jgi:hypothetical protein
MGCATTKEKIEANMMKLKLERVDIRNEREEKINELQELTGEKIVRKPIPDYYIHEDEINPSQNVKKMRKKIRNIKHKYTPSKRKRIKEESDYEESESNESDEDNNEDSEDSDNDDSNEDEESESEDEISTKRRTKRRN